MSTHTTTRTVQDLHAWLARIDAVLSGWMLRIAQRADAAAPLRHRRMGSWEVDASLRARALRDSAEARRE